jgi:uncharacterized protein
MRISIGELLAGRRAAQRVAFCELLEPPAEDVTIIQRVEGELLLTRAGRAVVMTGRLHTVLGLLCGACLARFEQPLDFPVAEEFGRASAAAGEPSRVTTELDVGDFVVRVGPDESIDVTDIVRQHLILALPISPRCREGCRGLCPECGADLNAGPCACRPASDVSSKHASGGRLAEGSERSWV